MSRILLIGFGNPLRCDDGFGWRLAQRLQRELHNPEIEIIACHQLTPDLAEQVSHAQYLIFADACTEPMSCELELQKLKPSHDAGTEFSHVLNPQTLLTMARTLFGVCPCSTFVLTARAHELGFGEQLSPQMACTLEKAFARIVALCEFLNPTCLNVSRIMQDVLPLPSSPRAPKLHKSHQYA